MEGNFTELPPDLPVPEDDGAADHLPGRKLPHLTLAATTGIEIDLAALADDLAVIYVYPHTARPGVPMPHDWDTIPGARGCTAQSCGYRDRLVELERHGAAVAGLSGQSEEDQREFAFREQITFPLLSDPELKLAELLGLPTFEADGITFYKRLTMIAARGEIAKCFYPVFPPDRDAADVVSWLDGRDPA
jgi:peroxiredoxin